MQVQPVHAVDLFADRLIFALAGQNIMIEDCVRESDLILIRHAAQAVDRRAVPGLVSALRETEHGGRHIMNIAVEKIQAVALEELRRSLAALVNLCAPDVDRSTLGRLDAEDAAARMVRPSAF